jgi:hypothetical protein
MKKPKRRGSVEGTKVVGQPHSTLSVGKPRTYVHTYTAQHGLTMCNVQMGKGVALLCKDSEKHHPLTQNRR